MSQLYQDAAVILTDFLARKAGLSTLTYNAQHTSQHKRQVFALCTQTLKYKQLIEQILESTQVLKRQKELRQCNRSLLLCMLYDLLFVDSGIQGSGTLKRLIVQHANALRSQLVRMKIAKGVATNEELLPKQLQNLRANPRSVCFRIGSTAPATSTRIHHARN